jgi:hypothetical protein
VSTSPSTSWLKGFVDLDAKGFVLTDSDLGDVGFEPLPFESSPRGNLRGRRCPVTVDETCCRSGGRRFQRDSFGSSKARADDDLKV